MYRDAIAVSPKSGPGINPNSKAYNEGIIVGDIINEINRQKTHGLNYNDAQQLIKNSTDQLLLEISR
nr:hypothetical protein BaRGS_005060 [Batillaria attramentaria]